MKEIYLNEYNILMDDLRIAFDRLQESILAIVDLVNARNKGGHDYDIVDLECAIV